jgi:hypothetical protein
MTEQTNPETTKEKLQILADINQSKPMFCNSTNSQFTYEFWILDFIHNFQNQAILISRIATTPSLMKNLAKLFNEQVAQYESKYGEIKTEIK